MTTNKRPQTKEEWYQHAFEIGFRTMDKAVASWQQEYDHSKDYAPGYISEFILNSRREYFRKDPGFFSSYEEMVETFSEGTEKEARKIKDRIERANG